MLLRKLPVAVLLGLIPIMILTLLAARLTGPGLATTLEGQAERAIAAVGGRPVTATFVSGYGWPTRHPVLSGAERLDEATRDRIAKAVAAVPGVGGVSWADGTARAESAGAPVQPLHCQEDVEQLLRARSIRFEEGSARIDAASQALVGEVAAALAPCLGSIIAITGHTDATGPEPGNLALSLERAQAVRQALIARGIPSEGLRPRGLGSRAPVTGLDPSDPANRRIEFSVVSVRPIEPTPVDTPGPR